MLKLQETVKYRVDSENEAISLIEKTKQEAGNYEVKKSSYLYKTKKKQGVVIDEWWVVELCLKYNDEQLPEA